MKRLIFTGIIVALALGLIFSGVPVAADDLGYSKIHIGFSVNPGHPGTLLEKGSRILHSADGTTKVYNKAGSLIMKTIDSESDMIVTQVGDKKANHIYFVPDNSTVVQNGNTDQVLDESNVLILTVINDNRSIVVPGLNPWIANTEYNFTFANSSSYYGSWSVPAPPINTNNTAFYWIGTIGKDFLGQATLVQPVLQWNQAGYSNMWTYEAFILTPNGLYGGGAYQISQGATVSASVSNSGTNWTAAAWTSGGYTSIKTMSVNMLVSNKIYTCLEVYRQDGTENYVNADMPGSSSFTGLTFNLGGSGVSIAWTGIYDHSVPGVFLSYSSPPGSWVNYNIYR